MSSLALAPFRAVAAKLLDPSQPILRAAVSSGGWTGGANDPDANLSGHGWYRRLSGGGVRRDIPDTTRRAAVERAWDMVDAHPLVARYVSAMIEWAGEGEFKVTAADERVQAVCDEHMGDPRNEWETRLPKYLECMVVIGELYLPARVNKFSGAVVLDYFDPADVSQLLILEGSNCVVDALKYAPRTFGESGRVFRAVRPVRNEGALFGRLMAKDPRSISDAEIAGVLVGRWNNRLNSDRGRADFLASLDPLAMHQDFMTATLERAQLLARFMGDVTVKGNVSQTQVDARAAYYAARVPQYGTVPFHNEQEDWRLEAASNNAADAAALERMFRVWGSAPMAMPPTIFGDMTEGNRSVATSVMEPAYLRAKSRQKRLIQVIRAACTYAVDSVWLCNPERLAGVEDWSIDVTAPKLLVADPAVGAPVLGAVVGAMLGALSVKALDVRTVRQVTVRMLAEVGVEDVTVEDVEARLAEEAQQQDPATAGMMSRLGEELRRAEAGEVGAPVVPGEQPAAAPAPADDAAAEAGADIQQQRLLGTAVADIVRQVVAGDVPRESALAVLEVVFSMTPADAERILGPAGKDFAKPATAEPVPGVPRSTESTTAAAALRLTERAVSIIAKDESSRERWENWEQRTGYTSRDGIAVSNPGGRPKIKRSVNPPQPVGKAGGTAGGYTATGRTNTSLGDAAEKAVRKLGVTSLLPPGKRQNPLDVRWDASDLAFEVKAQTTAAAEYKVKMKAHEAASKIRYAKRNKLKPATMIVVVNEETKRAHAYWREGIGNFRLNPDNPEGWNYMGETGIDL